VTSRPCPTALNSTEQASSSCCFLKKNPICRREWAPARSRCEWLQGKRGHHLPASATATPSSMSTAVTSPYLDEWRVAAPYGSKDQNAAVQPHSLSKSRPRISTSLSRIKSSKIEKFRPESAACVFFRDFYLFYIPFGRGACSASSFLLLCRPLVDPTPSLLLSYCACSCVPS
jgi:hypothetical protein